MGLVTKWRARREPRFKSGAAPRPRLLLTEPCLAALSMCMQPEIRIGHEGICYLLGQTDGFTTLAVAAIRPEASTTERSFDVAAPAMARVVRSAVDLGLQVVGQVHTHPASAYHSSGDEVGARIAYAGYASLVLPDYGRRLPRLEGAAAYMYRAQRQFALLQIEIICGVVK